MFIKAHEEQLILLGHDKANCMHKFILNLFIYHNFNYTLLYKFYNRSFMLKSKV